MTLTLSVRRLLRGHLLLYAHVWSCITCLLFSLVLMFTFFCVCVVVCRCARAPGSQVACRAGESVHTSATRGETATPAGQLPHCNRLGTN